MAASTYIPLDTWIFVAQGVDSSANIQYGFRYVLGASYSVTKVFKTRTPTSGNFYALTSAATFEWTNRGGSQHCICTMQYVRVYTDYIPYNEDMMISLALMDPDSKTSFTLATFDFLTKW